MRALDWIVNAVSYIHMYRDGTTVGNYPLLTRQSRAFEACFSCRLACSYPTVDGGAQAGYQQLYGLVPRPVGK
jgi:hypothetical protein